MGPSSTIKLLCMFVVVMATLVALPQNQAALVEKTHVYIYNLLEYGPTLTVHCRSKNDDLGDQDIPPNDYWTFSFGLDIFGGTRFDCTFKYNDETHGFPIYIQMRDNWACIHCNWTIALAGPCRKVYNGGRANDACYHWDNSAKESLLYAPPPFKPNDHSLFARVTLGSEIIERVSN